MRLVHATVDRGVEKVESFPSYPLWCRRRSRQRGVAEAGTPLLPSLGCRQGSCPLPPNLHMSWTWLFREEKFQLLWGKAVLLLNTALCMFPQQEYICGLILSFLFVFGSVRMSSTCKFLRKTFKKFLAVVMCVFDLHGGKKTKVKLMSCYLIG